MSLAEWWIDGDIGIDAAGNLYATWDTQGTNPDGSANDSGWLSFSTNHGARWSAPVQVPPDRLNVPHIMEVTGGGSGIAYVSWLSGSNPAGYALYLRAFSIPGAGCLARRRSPPTTAAPRPGPVIPPACPLSHPPTSWLAGGSDYPDVGANQAEIYAANITATLP